MQNAHTCRIHAFVLRYHHCRSINRKQIRRARQKHTVAAQCRPLPTAGSRLAGRCQPGAHAQLNGSRAANARTDTSVRPLRATTGHQSGRHLWRAGRWRLRPMSDKTPRSTMEYSWVSLSTMVYYFPRSTVDFLLHQQG